MPLTPEDHQQIQTLYAKYNWGIDFGPAEAWLECWTEQGALQTKGATHAGREGLLKFAQETLARPVKLRHWNSNLVIEESPNGASGKAYIAVMTLSGLPRPIQLSAVYEDELVKTPQGWRFELRKVTFDAVS
jgi:hypothetical protein